MEKNKKKVGLDKKKNSARNNNSLKVINSIPSSLSNFILNTSSENKLKQNLKSDIISRENFASSLPADTYQGLEAPAFGSNFKMPTSTSITKSSSHIKKSEKPKYNNYSTKAINETKTKNINSLKSLESLKETAIKPQQQKYGQNKGLILHSLNGRNTKSPKNSYNKKYSSLNNIKVEEDAKISDIKTNKNKEIIYKTEPSSQKLSLLIPESKNKVQEINPKHEILSEENRLSLKRNVSEEVKKLPDILIKNKERKIIKDNPKERFQSNFYSQLIEDTKEETNLKNHEEKKLNNIELNIKDYNTSKFHEYQNEIPKIDIKSFQNSKPEFTIKRKINIECFICKKILTTDKYKNSFCKNHFYCSNCLNNKTTKTDCYFCSKYFEEEKNFHSKKNNYFKPLKENDEKQEKDKNVQQVNNNFEYERTLTPFGKKNDQIIIDFQKPSEVIPSIQENHSKLKLKKQIDLENTPKIKIDIKPSYIPPNQNKTSLNEIQKIFEIPKKNEFYNQDEIISVSCKICRDSSEVWGFLCNHNVCLRCLILSCINQIYDFFTQYQMKRDVAYSNFHYICPIPDCKDKISVPTIMVKKYLKEFFVEGDLRFAGFQFLEDIIGNWIPYFDGLPHWVYDNN